MIFLKSKWVETKIIFYQKTSTFQVFFSLQSSHKRNVQFYMKFQAKGHSENLSRCSSKMFNVFLSFCLLLSQENLNELFRHNFTMSSPSIREAVRHNILGSFLPQEIILLTTELAQFRPPSIQQHLLTDSYHTV